MEYVAGLVKVPAADFAKRVLAEPAWAKKLSDEDRRGLTALFWSNVNPYGTFRLEMDKRLDLKFDVTVPRPRSAADGAGSTVTTHS